MTTVLFLFLDGIGLGEDNPETNPFVRAEMPNLNNLIGGSPLTQRSVPFRGKRVNLIALDASLGIPGLPQSATGQATLLTGRNVPGEIGGHYGPKPNPQIASIIQEGTLFSEVLAAGGKAGLLNAYPPGYFKAIDSGRRLYSAIPLAVTSAGIPLLSVKDLQDGSALSVDFTGERWSAQPGFPPAPVYTSQEAGRLLAALSHQLQLAWFDFWPSDYAGHRRSMDEAVELLEAFDQVFGALVEAWDMQQDLILLTSDHGNLEDLSQRKHTSNPVPCLLIGADEIREQLADRMQDLTDVAPAIRRVLSLPAPTG
jgi:hypothetical protein